MAAYESGLGILTGMGDAVLDKATFTVFPYSKANV